MKCPICMAQDVKIMTEGYWDYEYGDKNEVTVHILEMHPVKDLVWFCLGAKN